MAKGEFGLESRTGGAPVFFPSDAVEPGAKMSGHGHRRSNRRRRRWPSLDEVFKLFRRLRQLAVIFKPGFKPCARRGERWRFGIPGENKRRGASDAIEKDLYLRTAGLRRGLERARLATLQRRQDAFNMFACTQAIDAVVDATAGINWSVEAADFDLIGAAARGPRPEQTEKALVAIQRHNVEDFGAAAPAAQVDLVLVGGLPTNDLLPLQNGLGLSGPRWLVLLR